MMAAKSSFLPPSKSGQARASGKPGAIHTLTTHILGTYYPKIGKSGNPNEENLELFPEDK